MDIGLKSAVFQSMGQGFFDNTLALYTGQYGGWGDRVLMSAKLVWDYGYYWGVLSLLFYRNAMIDIPLMRELNPVLARVRQHNLAVQAAFRQRAAQRQVLPARGLFLDQYQVPGVAPLQRRAEGNAAVRRPRRAGGQCREAGGTGQGGGGLGQRATDASGDHRRARTAWRLPQHRPGLSPARLMDRRSEHLRRPARACAPA